MADGGCDRLGSAAQLVGYKLNNAAKKMITIIPEKSPLQVLWDYLCQNHGEMLRSPLCPVVISVAMYFIACLFYTILDGLSSVMPAVNRYRIHSEQPVKLKSVLKALALTFYNHIVFVFPASVAQWYWRPPLPLEDTAPTVMEFTVHILGCMVLFDSQYYLWHWAHHKSKWLYATFHAVHHEFSQPFCWVTQYMSAWEVASVGFWTTINPVLLGCHSLTGFFFMMFNIWVSVDDHSGYDFPWSLHNVIPFNLWGGSPKHDTHHRSPSTNYAPYFSHWDWVSGTSSDYLVSPAMAEKKKRGHKTIS
ncbi:cholesterol 25-hydroxylase-like protein 2 [Arapaima gigas]